MRTNAKVMSLVRPARGLGKHPETTILILKGARTRLASKFNSNHCQCTREDSRGGACKAYPAADGKLAWCPLCAVEAEQINGGYLPEFWGMALGEIASDIRGKRIAAPGQALDHSQETDRDKVIFGTLFEGRDRQQRSLDAFDKTIARLEAQA